MTAGVDIPIKTTADASGADKINAALGLVVKTEQELAAKRAQFLSAAEAEKMKVDALVAAAMKLQQARAAEAKEAEAAKVRAPLLAAGLQREREEVEKLIAAQKRATDEAYRAKQITANPWGSASQGKSVIEQHTAWQQQMHSITLKNAQAHDQLAQSQAKAAGSSRNMGNALLQASRGLQDMQYGLAGAVNNLEGIASALGLGAGVAGVVTVLAVAVQTLGPHVVDWLKSLDTEGAKLEELIATLNRASTAIKGEYTGNLDNAKRISDAFTEALKKEKQAFEAQSTALQHNLDLQRERQKIQQTADQQKLEADIQKVKDKHLPKEKEDGEIAALKIKALAAEKARQDDAANQKDKAQEETLNTDTKHRDSLKEKKAGLEKEKDAAAEYYRTSEEIEGKDVDTGKKDSNGKAITKHVPGLLEKAAQAKAALDVTSTIEDPVAYAAAMEKANAANAALEAAIKRASEIKRNAPEGRIRSIPEIQQQIDETTPDAKAADDRVRQEKEQLQRDREIRQLEQQQRDQAYHEKQREITGEIEDKPPQRVTHDHGESDPFHTRPKRDLYQEEQDGVERASQPTGNRNPSRAQRNLIEEERSGQDRVVPGPVPQRNLIEEERQAQAGKETASQGAAPGVEKIAASNDRANETMMRVAAAVEKSNELLIKRLEKLESRLRSQGVMS